MRNDSLGSWARRESRAARGATRSLPALATPRKRRAPLLETVALVVVIVAGLLSIAALIAGACVLALYL